MTHRQEDTITLPIANNHLWVFEDMYEVVDLQTIHSEGELMFCVVNKDGDEAAAFYLPLQDIPKLTHFLRRVYQKHVRDPTVE